MKIAASLLVGVSVVLVPAPGQADWHQNSADKGVATPPKPIAPERKITAPAEDVSAFVKCDGLKGHAGAFEKFLQIVAITATAGLSADLTNKPGAVKDRLSGTAGAAACDTAIASEGNQPRRVQLAVARTVHLIEAKDLAAALASVREIPSLVGTLAEDIGYQHSYGSATKLLEANILARMGRTREAEDAALAAAEMAPYEIVAGNHALPYINLTAALSERKRAFYGRMSRLMPRSVAAYRDALILAGDYKGAAEQEEVIAALLNAFNSAPHMETLRARQSLLLAMAGDISRSNSLADETRRSLADAEATSQGASGGINVAEADEALALQRIVRLYMDGDAAKARLAFTAREHWTQISPALIDDMIARLRVGAKPDELTGMLARKPGDMRKEFLARRLAALYGASSNDKDAEEVATARLYGSAGTLMKASDLVAAGRATWKAGDESRFLLKRDPKAKFDVVSTASNLVGLQSGEALLLHCALIAKTHGKSGFVLFPIRRRIDTSAVLFVDRGEAGLSDAVVFDADTVIRDLSPIIPDPKKMRES